MLELEEAVARILATVPVPEREEIPLAEADGRVLADPLRATVDLPPFDNSAMDGYAVRSADVASARPEAPAQLRVTGRVAAGEAPPGELTPGGCVRLFTGSPLPPGADAVVKQEDTRPVPEHAESILVLASAAPGEHLRSRGEDVQCGTLLAGAGTVLGAHHLGLLSACGLSRVGVGRRPRVALLATGSELREPGRPLAAGEILREQSPAAGCTGPARRRRG